MHPPFGEEEAEILGVYETPNSSRKWIYSSDGTLEAKRESDEIFSPNFFGYPRKAVAITPPVKGGGLSIKKVM